jgi:hypothetical protein
MMGATVETGRGVAGQVVGIAAGAHSTGSGRVAHELSAAAAPPESLSADDGALLLAYADRLQALADLAGGNGRGRG